RAWHQRPAAFSGSARTRPLLATARRIPHRPDAPCAAAPLRNRRTPARYRPTCRTTCTTAATMRRAPHATGLTPAPPERNMRNIARESKGYAMTTELAAPTTTSPERTASACKWTTANVVELFERPFLDLVHEA